MQSVRAATVGADGALPAPASVAGGGGILSGVGFMTGSGAGEVPAGGKRRGGRADADACSWTCGGTKFEWTGGAGCGGTATGDGGGGCSNQCDGAEFEPVFTWAPGGEWRAEIEYKYVGQGAGNLDRVMVPTNVRCRWGAYVGWALFAVLGVVVVVWLMGSVGTETTTTSFAPPVLAIASTTPALVMRTTLRQRDEIIPATTPTVPPSTSTSPGQGFSCEIYGDPHIKTFDGKHANYYSSGEYWLVKSKTVWIQSRYKPTPITHGLGVTKEIAISGPFLKNNILVISALSATWEGMPILTQFPSTFNMPNLVDIRFNGIGDIVQKGRGGKDLHVVHVKLPHGINLEVNRWNEPGEGDYINAKITMLRPEPEQDGQCGNFNSNDADDARTAVRARIGKNGVAVGELLFLDGKKTPIVTASRPDINDCPEERLQEAEEACKKDGMYIPAVECLIDVCFGGKLFAAQDINT
mmetsp:Transcript_87115/g.186786  ORF Transcript_87115/g.186786 Transcript_87115/m.186786 type:complete len:468 (+) Transcript_87115:107-1510(+)